MDERNDEFQNKNKRKKYILETKKNISEEILKMCIKSFICGYDKDSGSNFFNDYSEEDKAELITDVLECVTEGKVYIKECEEDKFTIEI